MPEFQTPSTYTLPEKVLAFDSTALQMHRPMSFYFLADILTMAEWVQIFFVGPVCVDEAIVHRQWPVPPPVQLPVVK